MFPPGAPFLPSTHPDFCPTQGPLRCPGSANHSHLLCTPLWFSTLICQSSSDTQFPVYLLMQLLPPSDWECQRAGSNRDEVSIWGPSVSRAKGDRPSKQTPPLTPLLRVTLARHPWGWHGRLWRV